MSWELTGLLVVGALAAWLARYARRMKLLYRQRGLLFSYPIPKAHLHEISDRFRATPLGPTPSAEAAIVGHGPIMAPGATTDTEAWVLAVLAKDARAMFEFGTATGRTTYAWARNSPADATIVTLTLASDQHAAYRADTGDGARETRAALEESRFDTFLYSGTDVAHKVTQLFGDSKAFEDGPYEGTCDLIFVDGSHAASYVRNDTTKALRMVRAGGLVVWHDYTPLVPGVFAVLNELARELPLVHLRGTALVAYRRPSQGPAPA